MPVNFTGIIYLITKNSRNLWWQLVATYGFQVAAYGVTHTEASRA